MVVTHTLLDLVIIAALCGGVWRGARTGATRQAAGLIGIVAALWLAAIMMVPAGRVVIALSGLPEAISPVVGFVVVAGVVIAGVAVAGSLLRRILQSFRLGAVDRGLGGALGGIRAAIVLSLVLLVTSSAAIPGSRGLFVGMEARERSVLHGPVVALAPALWDRVRFVAPRWHESLADRFYRFSDTI